MKFRNKELTSWDYQFLALWITIYSIFLAVPWLTLYVERKYIALISPTQTPLLHDILYCIGADFMIAVLLLIPFFCFLGQTPLGYYIVHKWFESDTKKNISQ